MGVATVRAATPAEKASAVDTVVLAFAADPVARWCWPDSHQYLQSPGHTPIIIATLLPLVWPPAPA